MKFITDGMLGKLTRWLRILGYNVKYPKSINDEQLIEIAKKERRVLLTRDFKLYKRAVMMGTETFFAKGATRVEKLANLAKRYDIKLEVDIDLSRCPKCNTRINPVSKKSVINIVHTMTFLHYDNFYECPNCGQVYWRGAHWKKIAETLSKAKRVASGF